MATRSTGLAVAQAEQHLVIHVLPELAGQGVEIVALFGHELVGIDFSDESAETVAHMRQFNLQPKPHTRIPMIVLIP